MGLMVGLCLFLAGSPPFLFGWLTTPGDRVYTGLMFDVPDHAQYWSWVTASRDSLFISNTMTPEPNAPIFLNLMMWSLGLVQRLTGASFATLFQLWRLLACLILGVSIVLAFRVFVPDRTRRRTAYALAILGSGFGWALVVLKTLQRLPDVPFPLDLYVVEPNTFFASYAYPYLALAQGLVLAAVFGAWRIHHDGHWQGYVLAIGGAVGLACTHAYDLITVYAVLGACWLFVAIRTRRIPLRLTMGILALGLASGPIAVYYQLLTSGDPLWRAVLAQYANAGVWTPRHLHLIVLMGLPLLLAAPWLPRALRSEGPEAWIGLWALVGLALIYLPVVFQIKLLTAWQFPLAILGAHTWHTWVWPRVAALPGVGRRLAASPAAALAVLVVLVTPTNLYLYVWRFAELQRHDRPYYLHRDEAAALAWLAQHAGPDDVVLAPLEVGQFVPNYGESRAFLAHWAMTTQFFRRRDAVEQFFRPETPDSARRDLLARDGVTLVLRPEIASGEAAFDPASSPAFDPVFQRPSAAIYRWRGASAAASPGSTR